MNNIPSIVFATNNPHKLREARELAGGRIRILSLAEIGCHEEIPETCPDIEGNSAQKARWIKSRYGHDCFADDTGLFVRALNGAPGVMSARYAGDHCSPADNIRLLLQRLSEHESSTGDTDRHAAFRTVVTLIRGEQSAEEERQFEGRVEGEITREEDGCGGFGYDPVFRAAETGLTFASMTPESKNEISHRGRAMRQLFDYLLSLPSSEYDKL